MARKRTATLLYSTEEVLTVLEFFAVGDLSTAVLLRAVKGGVNLPQTNISAIFKVHLSLFLIAQFFITQLTLPSLFDTELCTQVNYTLYHAGCQFIFYKILTLSLLLLLDLYIFFLFSMHFYCKSANPIVTCCFASVTISSGNFMNFNSLIALPDVTAPGYSL